MAIDSDGDPSLTAAFAFFISFQENLTLLPYICERIQDIDEGCLGFRILSAETTKTAEIRLKSCLESFCHPLRRSLYWDILNQS